MNNRRVIIAGGSGFLGCSLARHLQDRGDNVTILSRNRPKPDGNWTFVPWDGRTIGDWASCLQGAHVVVNLVGRTVDCIKTPANKDVILRSRVEATRVLGLAMTELANPPPVWIQMSTAHIYGDPPTIRCTEDAPVGIGFAPEVGMAWEAEFEKSHLDGQRGLILRTSFVVGRDQGAGGGALG